MKILRVAVLAAVILMFFLIIMSGPPGKDGDALYQVSVLRGLMLGDYDGTVTVREIRRHGDFGLGTFDRLDGEAVELDGVMYQVKSDGSVKRVDGAVTVPFAMATFFGADSEFPVSEKKDLILLQEFLDNNLPTKNIPYAVRVDGEFSYIKVRSVPAQSKPYPALTEVVKGQSVFEFRDIEGTLVGFRVPDHMAGVNMPGYHMHFLSRDKTKGGHVLEIKLDSGEVKIDDIRRFVMVLPQTGDFNSLDFSDDPGEGVSSEK